jgi:hypothetical protein
MSPGTFEIILKGCRPSQFTDAVLALVPIHDDPLDGPVHTNEYFHFWAEEVQRSPFAEIRWVNGRRETIVIYDHDA